MQRVETLLGHEMLQRELQVINCDNSQRPRLGQEAYEKLSNYRREKIQMNGLRSTVRMLQGGWIWKLILEISGGLLQPNQSDLWIYHRVLLTSILSGNEGN